jgi:hypothetical protein
MSRSYSITRIALTLLLGLAVLGACFGADSGLAKPGHLGATAVSSSLGTPAAAVADGARSRLRLQNAGLPTVALAYVTTVIASGTSPFPTREGSPIDLFSLRVRI